jgi:hypothetical protein
MASDEITRPVDGSDVPETAGDDADTESHSFGLLMGMNALGQAREADARARARARKVAEEPLPPLTRQWPRMRDDRKG